jgi:hypothetical protein
VIHTYPNQYEKVYRPLVGYQDLEGPSLQMGEITRTHDETLKWLEASAESGKQWVANLDEIGPAGTGVMPDGPDTNQDEVRKHALWGNLMAGGGGSEWYFGYQFPHNDLVCEDWRSRDRMWDYTRFALSFFQENLPFNEMASADDLASGDDVWVLAKPGEVYVVYLINGGRTDLSLTSVDASFQVRWYNPRTGAFSEESSRVEGGASVQVGPPPIDASEDWAVLLTRIE